MSEIQANKLSPASGTALTLGDSGDTLTYSIVSDVSNGTTSLSGAIVTYTPDDDWNGTDTFTYNVNDGEVLKNTIQIQ